MCLFFAINIFEPFDITIDCAGRFKRDSGDIWWAGVRENKVLYMV